MTGFTDFKILLNNNGENIQSCLLISILPDGNITWKFKNNLKINNWNY